MRRCECVAVVIAEPFVLAKIGRVVRGVVVVVPGLGAWGRVLVLVVLV